MSVLDNDSLDATIAVGVDEPAMRWRTAIRANKDPCGGITNRIRTEIPRIVCEKSIVRLRQAAQAVTTDNCIRSGGRNSNQHDCPFDTDDGRARWELESNR